MSREQKRGLAALLHQSPTDEPAAAGNTFVPESPQPEKTTTVPDTRPQIPSGTGPEEQITIKAPVRYLKVIDRYRLAMILKTGNVNFTKKDAFTDIMKFFEENSPVELPE